MRNKIITLVVLVGLSAGLSVAVLRFENDYLRKALYSLIAMAALYLVFKFIFEEAIARRIRELATRFSFRRTVSAFFLIGAVLALATIWVEAQNLVVAYGIVGAGVVVALQDFFKDIAGGLVIFIRGSYKVGDRIEINSRKGDVIDIDLMNTTLLEIGEWVSGDQPTGRLCLVPNGLVLSHTVHNYTKDHDYIWDEINIPITYDSDWHLASEIVLGFVTRETEDVTQKAQ
jgi:small-conductance mechanosensitive channel